MSTVTLTSLARLPLLLLRGVDDPSVATAPHTRGASSRDLGDPDGRVPLSVVWAIWRDVLERVSDPSIGLRIGRRATVRGLGLVGYIIASSHTLGDALQRLGRYCRILRDGVECRMHHSGGAVGIVFHDHAVVDWAVRQQADARLAGLLAVCRRLTGQRIVPRAVEFPYGRPSTLAEHRRTFGTDRLRFGRPHAALILGRDDLACAVRSADETLAGYLERLGADTLARLGDATAKSIAADLTHVLAGMLGSEPATLDTAGARLGMSARTVQRRLRDEGTSFANVLEQLRRREAELLLRQRSLTIEAVAARLGYSEPSTFYRAFRRWRRMSPGAFRGRLTAPRDDSSTT